MKKLNKFGERLRELRKERNLTQKQLAEEIGIYKSPSISEWELGKKEPCIDTIIKLSRVLNVTVGYLVGAEDY